MTLRSSTVIVVDNTRLAPFSGHIGKSSEYNGIYLFELKNATAEQALASHKFLSSFLLEG
ncbi:hypothetical protein NNL21_23955 [Paenibacillus mendelii]|nr:hypothetical protein [Paenibacillus mendelii]